MAHRKPLRSLHGWRGHRTRGQMAEDPTRRAGGGFEEVPLRAARSDRCAEFEEAASGGSGLLHDSVLLLRAMATPNECAHLARAADRFCAADVWSDVALKRVECHPDGVNLDGRSHALAHLLLSRALWYIEVLLPDLAAQLFPDAVDLADFWFKFSGQEPMLNRYTEGGCFEPHQDGHALTVLIPLSTADVDFRGGGTAFWSEATIGSDATAAKSYPPSLVLAPPPGTAIFWRGHLTHAGLPVTAGVRHVFVASFDLRVPRSK